MILESGHGSPRPKCCAKHSAGSISISDPADELAKLFKEFPHGTSPCFRVRSLGWHRVVSVRAEAKGPVVKLVVSGPDLAQAIEVTDAEAIDVVIYGATFIDRERGPQNRASQ